MTITKNASWRNGGSSISDVPVRRSSGIPVGDGRSFRVSSSDSSDSESFEPLDGNVCQVGDQFCELPCELFEAPDLTGILSLDTWNHVLNDEEREALAIHLPCMDEDTYRLTLRQLLGGEVFNFSSPLVDLLQMLKSGDCNPKAGRYRNALMCLQRKEHHHRVRTYHNAMMNSFLQMQSLWQGCPESNLAERLEIWKTFKGKGVKLTSQFFIERRAGPLENQHYKRLLKRRESYLKVKEETLAAQSLGTSVGTPDVDSNFFCMPKKLRREADAIVNNGPANVLDKGKKARPKGVLKLLPKPVIGRNATMGVMPSNDFVRAPPSSYPEAENSFEDKLFTSAALEPTISPSMEWSSASPVKEKVAFKSKSDKGVKVMGGRKRYKREHECIVGSYKDLNGSTNAEYLEDQHLLNLSHNRGLYDRQGAPISSNHTEEIQTSPFGFDLQGADEPRFEGKRRNKPKGPDPVENRESGPLFEVNTFDDAYIGQKEMHNILGDKGKTDMTEKSVKRSSKKVKACKDSLLRTACSRKEDANMTSIPPKTTKKSSAPIPPIASTFPFSTIHLLSAVRSALTIFNNDQLEAFKREKASLGQLLINNEDYLLVPPKPVSLPMKNESALQQENGLENSKEREEKNPLLPSIPVQEIVKKVEANPGDPRILEAREPLQGLIRGALKILSSKTSHPGMKGWKPLVVYSRTARGWSWIGPVTSLSMNVDIKVVQTSSEEWMISAKMLYKLQEVFCNWLKHEQEILQQLGQLALALPLTAPVLLDEKERFRDLRAQKSLMTISPTSEDMRVYFRREEVLRYSVPDRAFSYTCYDGRKSVVAPLRRTGGKPNSKARGHVILKSDRPPHVTILCLVRDAAARLPGSIGTRADVCSLLRDSQYIVEDVSDAQLNQVVSGALDRLHYERDPCVRFDGDRKLWVYLHSEKDDEDFEDDATSSTKRWRRTKRDGTENPEFGLTQEFDFAVRDDPDASGLGLDFGPASCFGGPSELSPIYPSAGRNDLPFTHPTGSLTSPLALELAFSGSGRDDGLLHFIDLPPSIQPPCVNMQQSHPMGWEVLSNRWDQDVHIRAHDKNVQEDFGGVASIASLHGENELLIDGAGDVSVKNGPTLFTPSFASFSKELCNEHTSTLA